MTKNIVEELPTRKHPVAAQKPAAGKEKPQDPEKKVKQAVYDIRYRARREEVPLRTAYSQYMSNSGLGGNERTIVKKKLFGDGPMKENFVAEVQSEAKEAIANTDLDRDQRFLISEAGMKSEIDLMQSFRKGKYSSVMIFFNHSTGAYEEYVYKLKESYDNMAHLGGQESVSLVPNNEKGELSDYPTRVMTMILDHESWFNEPGIANPEDPNATDPNKFADWQKYYTAQGIARAELLRNQEGEIKIPGNPLICAGDKIDIRIASKLASELRKTKPYDEESSGVYLIKKVMHIFNFTDGNDGTCKTTLELFRDSYGVKDFPSNHGNK